MSTQTINVTALPGTVNHTIYKGDTFEHFLNIKEDGVLVDLSGDTFSVRIATNRGAVLHTLVIGSGVTLVSTGRLKYGLTPIQTAALPTNCELVYDVQWTKASGFVKTIEKGTLKNIADV